MPEFKNICFSYGEKQILKDFSFSVEEGISTGILGPSGLGKTTLMNIASGLIKPQSGTAEKFSGKRYSFVFQEDRLCRQLSALMNLAIVLDKPDKAELSLLLGKMGLTDDEIRRPVSQLSGGQKRRVAILRSLVSDSDVVLMDEPFKGLDEDTRRVVIAQVKELLAERILLVITHDEQDAELLNADIVEM